MVLLLNIMHVITLSSIIITIAANLIADTYLYTSTLEGASDDHCDPTWRATCDAVAFLSSNGRQVFCYNLPATNKKKQIVKEWRILQLPQWFPEPVLRR